MKDINELAKKEVAYDRQMALLGVDRANTVLQFWIMGYRYCEKTEDTTEKPQITETADGLDIVPGKHYYFIVFTRKPYSPENRHHLDYRRVGVSEVVTNPFIFADLGAALYRQKELNKAMDTANLKTEQDG